MHLNIIHSVDATLWWRWIQCFFYVLIYYFFSYLCAEVSVRRSRPYHEIPVTHESVVVWCTTPICNQKLDTLITFSHRRFEHNVRGELNTKKKKQCFSLSAVHGWEVIRWSLVQFQLLYFINTRRTGWTCFFITDGEQSSTIRLVGIDSVVFHPNYHSMERPIIIIHQIIFIICVWVDHERAPSTVTQHQHTNGWTLRKIEK